jgi:signal transduction histidine kinase
VHLLPEGWQFPDATAARIVYDSRQVCSHNFAESPYVQRAEISAFNRNVGSIEVRYLVEKPKADEGPFLLQERHLLETVAAELGSYFERKEVERIRARQNRELELYASLLRHDLRNDVGVLLGNVDAIRMLVSDRDEIVEELLVSTEAVCDRMLGLLKALGLSVKMAEKNIVSLVERVSRKAEEASMNLSVTIEVDHDAEELTVPESALLPMVFDNLLRNAANHAGEKPNVRIRISREGDNVRLVVSDDGPGVPDEILDVLFTRGGSTRAEGGLGLYLSREIVEAMGGSIELESPRPGYGATFCILLPLL